MALSTMNVRAPSRIIAGKRVARVAVSRRALRIEAVKKSVGDLTAADLQGKKVFGKNKSLRWSTPAH